MSEVAVIPFAVVGLKTMADGTMRFSVDIEPIYARDAFMLFGVPGTPGAMTALKVGYAQAGEPKVTAQAQETEPTATKEKIGPLAYWLVLRCNEQEFWLWLESLGYKCQSSQSAGVFVKSILGIESRKEIDGDVRKENMFHGEIRAPYARWCAARGVTT